VWHGDELVSLAFSAFVLGRALEIGVETKDGFRGLGLAARSCEVFIEHCLAHGLEPVWSCRKGNLASQRTAENLGFHVTREIPYFELIAK
jgi:RimJ/RimL family protein N-acetyltransferase